MKAHLWVAAMLLLGLQGHAGANTLGYGTSGNDCLLFAAVVAAPQPVWACGVADEGTLAVGPEDCTASGCTVRAAGSATASSNPPGLLQLTTRLVHGSAQALVCLDFPPTPAGSAGCAGTTNLLVEVEAGECGTFTVLTIIRVNNVGLPVIFTAATTQGFEVCRDAAGSPTLGGA